MPPPPLDFIGFSSSFPFVQKSFGAGDPGSKLRRRRKNLIDPIFLNEENTGVQFGAFSQGAVSCTRGTFTPVSANIFEGSLIMKERKAGVSTEFLHNSGTEGGRLGSRKCFGFGVQGIQGYLAHKNTHLLRTLQKYYA